MVLAAGSIRSSEIGDSNLKKPILVVASQFPKEVEDRIDRDYDPRRNPNTVPFSREQLLAAADGADAIFITLMDRLDSIFFQRVSPTVRVIATYSVGFEHIDLQGAAKKKIAVAYTPGVNHEATADIAMLLLLGASRRAYEAQELVRTGAWRPLTPNMLLGWQLGGKVLDIFGMGKIGQAMARRARGFGMNIHYSNTSKCPPTWKETRFIMKTHTNFFGLANFLVCTRLKLQRLITC